MLGDRRIEPSEIGNDDILEDIDVLNTVALDLPTVEPLLALGKGGDEGGVGNGIAPQPHAVHAAKNLQGALPLTTCGKSLACDHSRALCIQQLISNGLNSTLMCTTITLHTALHDSSCAIKLDILVGI